MEQELRQRGLRGKGLNLIKLSRGREGGREEKIMEIREKGRQEKKGHYSWLVMAVPFQTQVGGSEIFV